jgi:hypothetical protein
VNKLRPSRTVAKTIPNAAANQHLENLVATRHAVITRLGKTYDTIYFMSPSFPGVEISAARRYVIVMVPGHANAMWPHFAPAVRASIVPNLPPIAATQTIIGDEIFFVQNCAEDIVCVRADGFEVDDDNDPAPENVPGLFVVPPAVVDGGLFEGQSWGWDRIDRRQTAGGDMMNHCSLRVSPPSGRPTSSSSCTSSR